MYIFQSTQNLDGADPTVTPPTPDRESTRPAERSLAPDLARGMMLLLIVLSNTSVFLYGLPFDGTGLHPEARGALDSAVQFLMTLALDLRVYPLFAFLFGYGMVQLFLSRSTTEDGEAGAARTLRRRSLWLMAFGLVHAALLLPTDVLAAWGILGLVICWLFLHGPDRRLLAWAGIGAGLLGLLALLGAVLTAAVASGAFAPERPGVDATKLDPAIMSAATPDYLASAVLRLSTWATVTAVTVFGVVAPTAVLLGMWAARRRILEEPGRYLPLLRRTALLGTALGLAGALPSALVEIGALTLPRSDGLEQVAPLALQWSTGLPGGLGYVALIALAAHWISAKGPPGPVTVAVSATGKRSLSNYLAHSIPMAPLLAAWGLGWGAHMTSTTMALFAVGLWLITLLASAALERLPRSNPLSSRGPFELLMRRLVYRTPAGS